MKPEDVPAELVEAAELALADRCNNEHENGRDWCACPDEGDLRAALAAVLPLAQAEAWDEGAASRGMYGDADEPNPYREGSQS